MYMYINTFFCMTYNKFGTICVNYSYIGMFFLYEF